MVWWLKMMMLGIVLSLIFGFVNAFIGKKLYYKNKDTYMWLTFIFIGILWILCFIAMFNLYDYYKIFGYTDGNDFLWNWPFNTYFGIEITFDFSALIWYEILIILSFPFWYKLSATRFHHFFGRRPWQKGMVYLFTVHKRPKGVKKGEKVIKPPLCEFKECDDKLLERKIE